MVVNRTTTSRDQTPSALDGSDRSQQGLIHLNGGNS
jgi:hypothetical protein